MGAKTNDYWTQWEYKKLEKHEAAEWLTRKFRVKLIRVTKCDQMIMMYLTVWLPSRSNNLTMITNFHRINSTESSCCEYIESKSKICISFFRLFYKWFHTIQYTSAKSSLYKYFSFRKFISFSFNFPSSVCQCHAKPCRFSQIHDFHYTIFHPSDTQSARVYVMMSSRFFSSISFFFFFSNSFSIFIKKLQKIK